MWTGALILGRCKCNLLGVRSSEGLTDEEALVASTLPCGLEFTEGFQQVLKHWSIEDVVFSIELESADVDTHNLHN